MINNVSNNNVTFGAVFKQIIKPNTLNRWTTRQATSQTPISTELSIKTEDVSLIKQLPKRLQGEQIFGFLDKLRQRPRLGLYLAHAL